MLLGTDEWTSEKPPTPAWEPGPSIEYYRRELHIFPHKDCTYCTACYWMNTDLQWCKVKDIKKDLDKEPTCTEEEWDIFILKHI